jgi:diguanylate cyclase (GGDEF)-like protein
MKLQNNTFLSFALEHWYSWTAPPVPPANASFAQRVAGRRQQATSSTIFFFLLIEILYGMFMPFIPGHISIFVYVASIICLALTAYCNRRGYGTLAGLLPVLTADLTVMINLLALPNGLDTVNLPGLDVFVISTLIALPLLPPWCFFPIALSNMGIITGLLILLPKTPDLQHHLLSTPITYIFPIFLQLIVAIIAYRRGCSTHQALKEADRADEIQELYGEIHLLYEEQKRAAITDAITGLPNHRAIMQYLQETVAQEKSMVLLFVDLDHFKLINDTHGHLAGDAALREASKRLQEGVASVGKVGRYGGEEFAVVLPHTDILQASQIAEQLRLNIAATACVWQPEEQNTGIEIPISASIGVAIAPLHGNTTSSLLEAADRAMYRSKQNGRNQVSIADITETEAVATEQVAQGIQQALFAP